MIETCRLKNVVIFIPTYSNCLLKFAEHLSCKTPLDSTHTKKIAYTIFKDCMVISMYQQNSQLTFTSSKLT